MRKVANIIILLIIVLTLSACGKASFKDKKISLDDLQKVSSYELKNLNEYDGYEIINKYENNLNIITYKNDNVEFLNYDLNTDEKKIIKSFKMPNYIDYINCIENKYVAIYTNGNELQFLSIDADGNEESKKLANINSVAVYDSSNNIVLHYSSVVENKYVDTLSLIDKENFDIKEIKKLENEIIDKPVKEISGKVFSGISPIDDSLIYQELTLKNQNLDATNNISGIATFEYDMGSGKLDQLDFSKRVNTLLKFGNVKIYNLYLQGEPSSKGSFITKDSSSFPLPLGDSANYFLETVNKNSDVVNINSVRAIYSIDKKKGIVKHMDKGRVVDMKYKLLNEGGNLLVHYTKDNLVKVYEL